MPDTPHEGFVVKPGVNPGARNVTPPMPDTLTPDKLAVIRERHLHHKDEHPEDYGDAEVLLAHIDALTAEVERMDPYSRRKWRKDEILAILRGEQ